MGYNTSFYGSIDITRKTYLLLKVLMEKHQLIFPNKKINNIEAILDIIEDSELEEDSINISECTKNYEEYMEKFCFLIASIDPKNNGTIECYGDERDDIWQIEIDNGNVFIKQGRVIFEESQVFGDDIIMNELKIIQDDKRLDEKISAICL